MSKKLTEEQVKKIEVYGRCTNCGAPREMRTTEILKPSGELSKRGFPIYTDEVLEVRREMFCENGHQGW